MTQTLPAQHLPQTGFPSPGPAGLPTTTPSGPTGVLAPASGVKCACVYLTDALCLAAVAALVWLLLPSPIMIGIVVLQMAVVFSLLRARTGRTPGALLAHTAAVADGTSRAPGLKRQLIRSVLMTLLHLTVVGPLLSILLGRDGRDWVDRVSGTASADLRKPAASEERAQAQGAFSVPGDFAAAPALAPAQGDAVADQSFTNPTSPFPQSAPSANPVAPPNTTPWSWTGTPRTQEPPVPSAFPAQGSWEQPSSAQSAPHMSTGQGYNAAAAPQIPWGQQAPQIPTSAPQPWGQPVPQMPAGHTGYDSAASQGFQSRPGAPQPPVWRSSAVPPETPRMASTGQGTQPAQPHPGPPQAPIGGRGPANTGSAHATAAPQSGRGDAVNRDPMDARHTNQGLPAPATPGIAASPSRPRDVTPPPENRHPSGPRRAAAQAPDITLRHSAKGPQHSAASPASAVTPEPVAWLVIDSGQREKIDAVLVLGRDPGNAATGERLVAVPDPTHSLSRTHMRVGVTSTGPWVEDAFSTNGIVIRTPENMVTRLESGKRTPIAFGTTLILGERTMKIMNE